MVVIDQSQILEPWTSHVAQIHHLTLRFYTSSRAPSHSNSHSQHDTQLDSGANQAAARLWKHRCLPLEHVPSRIPILILFSWEWSRRNNEYRSPPTRRPGAGQGPGTAHWPHSTGALHHLRRPSQCRECRLPTGRHARCAPTQK